MGLANTKKNKNNFESRKREKFSGEREKVEEGLEGMMSASVLITNRRKEAPTRRERGSLKLNNKTSLEQSLN